MAGEGIPEDLKERARTFAEWDDIWEQLTDWEIEQHRARPQVRRRNNMDDYVADLVGQLRDLADEAQEHGLFLHADVHGTGGPVFDGIAACADEVHAISPIHGGSGMRVAKWDSGHGSVSVYERKDAA